MVFDVCFPNILAFCFLKKKHPLIIPWMFFLKTTNLSTVAVFGRCADKSTKFGKPLGPSKRSMLLNPRCLSENSFRDLGYETKVLTEIEVGIGSV